MERELFDRFTAQVVDALRDEPHVIGVVALGSTAALDREPDEWSDHDMWVVTVDDHANAIRDRRDWLPDPERIVVHAVETEHGRTVIYDDGHVVEFAVFDESELEVASANTYRVLLDHSDIADRMAAIADGTVRRVDERPHHASPTALTGQLLTQLTVGAKRWARGERLSANDLIRHRAVRSLVLLLGQSDQAGMSDDLDPMRRVELAHPSASSAIDAALAAPAIETAAALLELATALQVIPPSAADTVRSVIDRAGAGAS